MFLVDGRWCSSAGSAVAVGPGLILLLEGSSKKKVLSPYLEHAHDSPRWSGGFKRPPANAAALGVRGERLGGRQGGALGPLGVPRGSPGSPGESQGSPGNPPRSPQTPPRNAPQKREQM